MLQCNSMKPTTCKKSLLSFMLVIIASLSTFAQQTLWVGQSYTFDVSSSVMGITANMSWSTNGGYLSLSGSGFYRTITVTQYFSGTATVTCEWDYKLTGNGSYTHTKRQVTISCRDNQVSISPTSMTMSPGETRYVSYRHQYDNQYTSAANAYFQSSDPSICTVTSSGEIIAKKAGTAYINVYSKISSVSPYCKVTVRQVEPTSVSLPSSITMTVGETRSIFPTIYPANAQTSYSWTSSDTQVVSISSSGTITAKKHGSAVITVRTLNGLSSSCRVSVQKRKLNLTSSHRSGLIEKGTDIILTSDVSDAKIYYTINNSIPSANSILYRNPITINNPTCIKAVAIHPDYMDSDVMTIDLTTTSLSVISTTPDLSMPKSAPHLMPCIIYNSPIREGANFNSIKCTANQENIEFTAIINDSKLYIIPKEDLNGKSISIFLETETVQNMYGEPNMEFSLHFDYEDAFLKEIKKFGSQYYLYENGDWYIWGYSENFPNQSISAPNQYTPVLSMTGVKEVNQYLGYYITNDNILMGWGTNYNDHLGSNPDNSILGDGSVYHRNSAVVISYDVVKYETGWTKGLLKSDGTLWLWGQNRFGQIGKGNSGTNNYSLSPVKVLSEVQDFSLGTWHSLALKNDGSVWAWGFNKALGKSSNATTPVQIFSNGVREIKAGSCHNIVLKENGEVYCFGENDCGQIGKGYTSAYEAPYKVLSDAEHVYATYEGSYALKSNGELYRWGAIGHRGNTSVYSPSKIASGVKRVYITDSNVFILKDDDSLWGLGENSDGLLGLGTHDNSYSKEFSLVFEDVLKAWPLDSKIFVQKKDGAIWALGSYIGTGNSYTAYAYKPIEFMSNTTQVIDYIGLPSEIVIEVDHRDYLPISIMPVDANHKELSWSSDNENIVTVDNGIIFGVSEGEANITVTTNDYQEDHTAQCLVKVVAAGATFNDIRFCDNKDITIYDVSGILLYHGNLSTLPNLNSGVYLIKQGNKIIKYLRR